MESRHCVMLVDHVLRRKETLKTISQKLLCKIDYYALTLKKLMIKVSSFQIKLQVIQIVISKLHVHYIVVAIIVSVRGFNACFGFVKFQGYKNVFRLNKHILYQVMILWDIC